MVLPGERSAAGKFFVSPSPSFYFFSFFFGLVFFWWFFSFFVCVCVFKCITSWG